MDNKIIVFQDKKGHKFSWSYFCNDSVTYHEDGANSICIKINVESLMKEKMLEKKEDIYELLITIITSNNIPYSVSRPQYEITSFGDDERKYISPSVHEIIMQSLISALGTDLALQVKLEFDFPILFENNCV